MPIIGEVQKAQLRDCVKIVLLSRSKSKTVSLLYFSGIIIEEPLLFCVSYFYSDVIVHFTSENILCIIVKKVLLSLRTVEFLLGYIF